MGRFGNVIAGAVGTAVLATNCFFAGVDEEPSILSNDTQQEGNNNSVVSVIQNAPSQTVDLSDYLSDTSEVIETAVKDHVTQEETQDEIDANHSAEVDAMTTGAAPPNENEQDNENNENDRGFEIDENLAEEEDGDSREDGGLEEGDENLEEGGELEDGGTSNEESGDEDGFQNDSGFGNLGDNEGSEIDGLDDNSGSDNGHSGGDDSSGSSDDDGDSDGDSE